MTKIKQNFTLNQQDLDDIRAMADYIGSPGPRGMSAGLRNILAEWRRLKATHEFELDRAAQIARQRERLDAMERHEEAEGR